MSVAARANSLSTSSRRTPGPIATGVRGYERHLPPCPKETARRMGPGVRRDDEVGCTRSLQIPLSSSGLPGRSSTPRRLHPSPSRGGVGGGGFTGRARLWLPPSPTLPRKRGEGAHQARRIPLSSSGLTGRSSTPRRLHPSPLRGGVGGGGFTGRARLWLPPSPTLPRQGGGRHAGECSC